VAAIQSSTTQIISEDKKRTQIRKYFIKAHPLEQIIPFIIAAIGFFMLSTLYRNFTYQNFFIGIIVIIIGGVWLFIQIRSELSGPTDDTISTWFRKDMERLIKRSLDRLNIDESELIRKPLVITGPILWAVHGVSPEEILWKKGKDDHVRFSINDVTIIHLTANKLSSYQCNYNFIRGASLNERDDEYYYRDVVAVSTREDSTNYTLPNNQVMKHAQSFSLSVSNGDRINVIVNSRDIIELTGGEFVDTGVDAAIKAIRKVLGEKKV
jgi:hypothetical protein